MNFDQALEVLDIPRSSSLLMKLSRSALILPLRPVMVYNLGISPSLLPTELHLTSIAGTCLVDSVLHKTQQQAVTVEFPVVQ